MPDTSARTDTPNPRVRLPALSNSRKTAFCGPKMGFAVVSAGVAVTGATLWVLMRGNDPFRLLFPPLTHWAIRRALPGRSRSRLDSARGRFTSADVDRVAAGAWHHFDMRVHGIPAQPTVGSQLVLRLACWTAGLFHSLREEGIERGDAVELAADIMWQVFQLEGRFGQILTRMRPGLKTQPRRHLPDGTIDLGFPFGPPAYEARAISGDGVRSFEVVRCPAAAYFRVHGLADLGQAAFCDTDYALSEMQGLRLERHCTLMAGGDQCDFRWPDSTHVSDKVRVSP